ncbi:MAG TPA: hypothetical protein VHY20_02345, partial [Pirellulales bacterium]|nr:hypothetical protein [Pirellulales bacterium]
MNDLRTSGWLAACVLLLSGSLALAGDIEFAAYQQIEEVPAAGQPEGTAPGELSEALQDGLAPLPADAASSPPVSGDVISLWNVGAGVYFISPRWTSNPGILTTTSTGGGAFGPAITERSVADLNFGLNGSPYVWAALGAPSGFGL